MKFQTYSFQKNGLNFLTLSNESNHESIEIIPSLGGTVYQISLMLDGQSQNILMPDQACDLKDNPLFRGRFLFPFNDKIPQGRYQFDNHSYQLQINQVEDHSAIHGLVYNQCFDVIEEKCDESKCSVTLTFQIDKNQFPGYPFDVNFQIEYVLSENCFDLHFTIVNNGNQTAPIAFGWHPYFTFNDSLDNVKLSNQSQKYIEVDKELLPTMNIPECKNTEFDFTCGKSVKGMDLDIAITASEDGKMVLTKKNKGIVLTQDTSFFEYNQLFIPEDQHSIAVEPISAATNAFNISEIGLKVIKPGETIKTALSVKVLNK